MPPTLTDTPAETTRQIQARAAGVLHDWLGVEGLPMATWTASHHTPHVLCGQINPTDSPDRNTAAREQVTAWAEAFGTEVTSFLGGWGIQAQTVIDGIQVQVWAALDVNNDKKDVA